MNEKDIRVVERGIERINRIKPKIDEIKLILNECETAEELMIACVKITQMIIDYCDNNVMDIKMREVKQNG